LTSFCSWNGSFVIKERSTLARLAVAMAIKSPEKAEYITGVRRKNPSIASGRIG
jgi:hypothetical protein